MNKPYMSANTRTLAVRYKTLANKVEAMHQAQAYNMLDGGDSFIDNEQERLDNLLKELQASIMADKLLAAI